MKLKRYTAQDKANFAKRFKESNLERSDFCKLNNISYSSLHRWLKINNDNKKALHSFVPIKIKPDIIKNKTALSIGNGAILANVKIKLPNGIEIEYREGYANLNLVDYVKILREI